MMSPYPMPPETVLIAGPTASGKSAYAIKLARQYDGVIINTDSMQVYRQLQIVTARPASEELQQCQHVLYGHRDGAESYSVACWLEEVGNVLDDVRDRGKTPIFVGGTGLYFRGLMEGLSPVPVLDSGIRQKWRDFAKSSGLTEGKTGSLLYEELKKRDPIAANSLRPSDRQRLIRALEVIDSTGKSIVDWQNQDKGQALIGGGEVKKILLMPQRSQLHSRINERFEKMVSMGAIEEVKQFLTLGVDPALPVMKAIGVPQFSRFLTGETSLDEAIEKAKAATRQYAKRQSTWFNNQFGNDWQRLE